MVVGQPYVAAGRSRSPWNIQWGRRAACREQRIIGGEHQNEARYCSIRRPGRGTNLGPAGGTHTAISKHCYRAYTCPEGASRLASAGCLPSELLSWIGFPSPAQLAPRGASVSSRFNVMALGRTSWGSGRLGTGEGCLIIASHGRRPRDKGHYKRLLSGVPSRGRPGGLRGPGLT